MGALHSRYEKGNLLYWDTHQKRLIDAIGADVIKYVDDFTQTGVPVADTPLGWTVTLVEGGTGESTVALTDVSGGALLITTDDAENDGVNLQRNGEAFGMASGAGYLTYFGIRIKVSEATQSDLLVGLCITDTDLLGGMTDGAYFRKVDGSTSLAFATEKDSTETETTGVLTVAADTFYVLEFYFDGTTVEAFVDGVSVASHSTNLPDNELLTPSIHYLAGSAGAKTATVDWVRAIQVGR